MRYILMPDEGMLIPITNEEEYDIIFVEIPNVILH